VRVSCQAQGYHSNPKDRPGHGAMSIAYPIKEVKVETVVGLESHRVLVGSVWRTGNLLFRTRGSGPPLKRNLSRWALALDHEGRQYTLWKADHPRAKGLVIQPLDSGYCFEVWPVEP